MAMTEEQIFDCAFEMSAAWLKGAVTGDRNQIGNQLDVLSGACSQTLGVLAANATHQSDLDLNGILQMFMGEISSTAFGMKKAIENGDCEFKDFTKEK